MATNTVEAIRQKWISKDNVRKLLGFFATLGLQQDWEAAQNNPSLLRDCPWEYFLQKIREYCKPTENFIIRNYEFRQLSQMPNETFSTFFGRIDAAGKNVTSVNTQKAVELKNMLSAIK